MSAKPAKPALTPEEFTTVPHGYRVTYQRASETYDQAHSSLRHADDAPVLAAVADALALVVAACRGAIVRADQNDPVITFQRAWRPGGDAS